MLGGGARDNFQGPDLGEPRQNLILDAIGEIRIHFISAAILERQNRDGLLRR